MNTELIKMIDRALSLVYDTVHPMQKAAISLVLSKIKTELSKGAVPTEFTEECREMIKTPDDDKGWTKLVDSGYAVWLEAKLKQACEIIEDRVPVCPECGNSDVEIFVDTENFGYTEIYIPIHKCRKCNFKWTDDVGGEVWDKNRTLLKIKDERIKSLELENKRLLKCESDLRKIHEEHLSAVREANMYFRYVVGKLLLVKRVVYDI